MSATSPKSREARLREAIRLKQAQNRKLADSIPRRTLHSESPASEDAVEVHPLQRGLWLAHALDPHSAAYNLVSACRIRGALDEQALEVAYARLLAHHRLLRSSFRARAGAVEQVIHDVNGGVVGRYAAAPDELEKVATQVARKPFDLSRPPGIRLVLVEADSGDRILMLVLHHLLADERSLAGLWRDLSKLMDGATKLARGAQYDDWSAWQRERDEALGDTPGPDFWAQRIQAPLVDLALPYLPPAESTSRGGRLLTARLDPNQAGDLRDWAASRGTTPFVVGAFACKLLLQRLAKDPAFAIGTPMSVRQHPDMMSMLGAFINPVMITGVIDEAALVEDALAAFDRELRENMAHGLVPFQALVETFAPVRSRDTHPLFQAMFVHQEQAAMPVLGQARLEPLMLDLGEAKYELTLFLTEHGEGMDLALEYRQDRFTHKDMKGLLTAYEQLLTWLVGHAGQALQGFNLVSEADRAWLLEHGQGEALTPEHDPANCALLPIQIAQGGRVNPDAEAVVAPGGGMTYRALLERADQVSAALAEIGVEAGDRVGLYLHRGGDLIAGLLGILQRRAAYVPLDPAYPSSHSEAVLRDAAVRAVLSSEGLAGQLAEGEWSLLTLESMTESPGATSTSASTPSNPPGEGEQKAPGTNVLPVLPDDLAYLLYTSGSTGQPKGVMVTHENLRASTAARLQIYGVEPPRFLLLPSVAFDSSVAGIFGTLAAGGTLVLPSEAAVQDPRELARLIRSAGVSHLLCVPSLYATLLDVDERIAADLVVVIVAGERCPPQLVRRHFSGGSVARLFNEYGPTEGTVWATVHELSADFRGGDVPIGRPIPGVRVDVLDNQGRLLPRGVPGTAWISGPTVASGYWNRPVLSKEHFSEQLPQFPGAGRAYRTGDVLSWNQDGRLQFHGRDDEQVKLRGFRIEPGEVESVLSDLPGVLRAVVLVRGLGRPGGIVRGSEAQGPETQVSDTQVSETQVSETRAPEHLVAFVEGQETGGESGPAWQEFLAKRLPAHLVPTRLVWLDALPSLPNGKLDRARLRDWPLEEVRHVTAPDALSSMEGTLMRLWDQLLGCGPVSREDNFFVLGGTSLLAVQLALAIERELDAVIAPSEVFAHPTLSALAHRLGQEASDTETAYDNLFPIERSGTGAPLIFAIPHFFTELVSERFRGERPVWGLRGIGHRPEGNLGRWPTMEALGADILRELDEQFGDQPLILAGYSFGASMALEIARQLERQGRPVQCLTLISPMPFDLAQIGPVRLQIDALREPVQSLASRQALGRWLRTNHPFSLSLYRRLWRRTAIEGWRRFQCQRGRWRRRRGQSLNEDMQWADVRVDRFRLHTNYRPGTTAVPTVLFNGVEPATDAAATWRAHFTGPFEVVPIPDPHGDEAAVSRARDVIAQYLDRGRCTGEPS